MIIFKVEQVQRFYCNLFFQLLLQGCVLVTQMCLTLCEPVDCSPPGSSVHEILQARILCIIKAGSQYLVALAGSKPIQAPDAYCFFCTAFESPGPIQQSQCQSTLYDSKDCSLPGSSIHGIFQARTLEWIAISFSRGFSQPRDQTQVSHIAGRLFTV